MEKKCFKKPFVYRVSKPNIKEPMMGFYSNTRNTGYLGTGLYAYGSPFNIYPSNLKKVLQKFDMSYKSLTPEDITSIISTPKTLPRYKYDTSNLCFYRESNQNDTVKSSRHLINAAKEKFNAIQNPTESKKWLKIAQESLNSAININHGIATHFTKNEMEQSVDKTVKCLTIVKEDKWKQCEIPINHLLHDKGYDGIVPDLSGDNKWGVVIFPESIYGKDGELFIKSHKKIISNINVMNLRPQIINIGLPYKKIITYIREIQQQKDKIEQDHKDWLFSD